MIKTSWDTKTEFSFFFLQIHLILLVFAWKIAKSSEFGKKIRNFSFCILTSFYHRIMSFCPILMLIPYFFCIFSILFEFFQKNFILCLFPMNFVEFQKNSVFLDFCWFLGLQLFFKQHIFNPRDASACPIHNFFLEWNWQPKTFRMSSQRYFLDKNSLFCGSLLGYGNIALSGMIFIFV